MEQQGPWVAVLLFRFSALTYNGHRIHCDRPYATQVEGYPDLVVHGPLLALLALELPRTHAAERVVRAVGYRLVRPAFMSSRIVSVGRPSGPTVEVTVAAQDAEPSLTGKFTSNSRESLYLENSKYRYGRTVSAAAGCRPAMPFPSTVAAVWLADPPAFGYAANRGIRNAGDREVGYRDK